MIDDIRRARAYLSAVSHPPAIALSGLISAAGPVDAASMVRGGSAVTANLVSPRESIDPEALLPQIEELGGRLVIPEDDEWPTALNDLDVLVPDHELSCSPIALWVLGSAQLGEITSGSVAVVGSRAATAYGEHVAGEISYCLADAGSTVLASSGFGVDSAAHRGALATRAGRCVAVPGHRRTTPGCRPLSRSLPSLGRRTPPCGSSVKLNALKTGATRAKWPLAS